MSDNNTLIVRFDSEGEYEVVGTLYQYDINQKIAITGLSLPSVCLIYFSKSDKGDSPSVPADIVTIDGVGIANIPNSVLWDDTETSHYRLYAFIRSGSGESSETETKIRLRVNSCPKPDGENLPVDVPLLLESVEQVREYMESALGSKREAEKYANLAQTDADRAELFRRETYDNYINTKALATQVSSDAETVHADRVSAHESAVTAQTMKESATASASNAKTYMENAQQYATSANEFSITARTQATKASESAVSAINAQSLAERSRNEAVESATNASTSEANAFKSASQAQNAEQIASSASRNAVEKATQAINSAREANTSATNAFSSAQEASSAMSLAKSYSDSAQVAKEKAEEASAKLIGDIITDAQLKTAMDSVFGKE